MPQLDVDRMDGVEWPKVFIIVLNWNGWEDTIECLESLHTILYRNYNLVIVDNDSQDDSLERIGAYARGEVAVEATPRRYNGRIKPQHVTTYTRREAEDMQGATLAKRLAEENRNEASNASFVIIRNEQNFGYPEGNNIGMCYALKASADYVLLLNNDTVVDKHFLTELVRAADNEASIGVVGPKICFCDAPNAIQSAGARIDFWRGRAIGNTGKTDEEIERFAVDKLLPADFVSGSCFLIKRKVIEDVGMLDPTYFCYGEDIDWCLRISRAGYRIVCDLNAKIWHKSNVSTSKVKRCAEYYFHRNWVINARKYARIPQFISFLLLYPAYCIPGLLKAGEFGHIRNFVLGFIDGLFARIPAQSAQRP